MPLNSGSNWAIIQIIGPKEPRRTGDVIHWMSIKRAERRWLCLVLYYYLYVEFSLAHNVSFCPTPRSTRPFLIYWRTHEVPVVMPRSSDGPKERGRTNFVEVKRERSRNGAVKSGLEEGRPRVAKNAPTADVAFTHSSNAWVYHLQTDKQTDSHHKILPWTRTASTTVFHTRTLRVENKTDVTARHSC